MALTGCGTGASSTAKRYELHGKVVSVDAKNQTITVSHQAIPGYMDGMTMPFRLKDPALIPDVAAGDDISADLVVDGASTWLENPILSRATADPSQPVSGTAKPEPSPGDSVPDFNLTNQDGKRTHLNKYAGKSLALTFIYTRCPLPDYCILMNDNFAELERQLKTDPSLYGKTHLLTISFDPEHDSPAVLKTFGQARIGDTGAKAFDHWEFATGTKSEIKEVAQYFGLTYIEETGQIVHSLRTAVIGPDGKLVKLYRGNEWKPDEVLSDLRASVAGKN